MNILLVNKNKFFLNELTEFFKKIKQNPFTANTTDNAIKVLADTSIDSVIIEIESISDMGLVKYINDNYKTVNVLLYMANKFDETISVIKETKYKKLHHLYNLTELKKEIEKNDNLIVKSKKR